MKEVKFYGENDYATGHNLKRLEEIYFKFDITATYTLNEILELYNCTLYIDRSIFLEGWDSNKLLRIKDINKEIKSKIARYFLEIEFALEDLSEIQFNYKEDFLELFFRFKLDQKLEKEVIQNWLNKKLFNIYTLCQNKWFVKAYGDLIIDLIVKEPLNVKVIIEKYLNNNTKEFYLPNIDPQMLDKVLNEYIDLDEANSNYLKLLMNAGSVPGFAASPEIKLKARRKYEKKIEELFSNQGGLLYEHIVIFKRNLEHPRQFDIDSENRKFKFEFDKTWLESQKDYFTIIYNFIWLFEFIDSNGRISLVNLKSESSVLADALGVTGVFDYDTNFTFTSKENFSYLKLNGYYEILNDIDIELERVIEWYFNDYIKAEFNVENYIVELPSKFATYREKCVNLFPEIEYILMQFNMLCKYGTIDQELIAENNNGLLFSQIPSLLEKKYIYPTEKLQNIMYHIFSNQSTLAYVNEDLKGRNLFELITSNNLKMEDFLVYQTGLIQQLLEMNYLVEDDEGIIKWKNKYQILFLKDLYSNEVVIFNRLSQPMQTEVDRFIEEKLVLTKETLFSTLEQDYLDYYLNNHKFQNGLQLRNKYIHRRQVLLQEQQHKQNYLIGLKLLICILLKINEELCLAAAIEKLDMSFL